MSAGNRSPKRVNSLEFSRSGPGVAVTTRGLVATYHGGDDVAKRTCSIDGCDNPSRARNWCMKHYLRWRKHGDPLTTLLVIGDDDARFWANVEKTPTCWLWAGALSRGYGQFRSDGRQVCAHRWSYEQHVGPIPPGMDLDHLCRNPPCVNPDHLEPVTRRENTLRGIGVTASNARKTHCLRGHPFDAENTLVTAKGRECRECRRAWARASQRKARGWSQ